MRESLQIEELELPVKLEQSARKTLSIAVTGQGELLVKAPVFMQEREIEHFIQKKRYWIYKQAKRLQDRKRVYYTPEEEHQLREKARQTLTEKTDHYKMLLGVDYQKIRIADQKTRWGSCSSRGTISYNWRLILMPETIQDYVVVHELCHLLEMNHSSSFWHHVSRILPDYKTRRQWLKRYGTNYTS